MNAFKKLAILKRREINKEQAKQAHKEAKMEKARQIQRAR